MATDATAAGGEMVDGAMIVIGERCYFIPRDDLRSYRVPDDVAESVLDEIQGEVSGFSMAPDHASVFGVQFDPGFKPSAVGPKAPLQFSGLINHCATILR